MADKTLQIINLSKFFHQGKNTITILQDCSFSFVQGRSYAIMGPSGIGKSTILHILAGIEQPSSGNVAFDGKIAKKPRFGKKSEQLFDDIAVMFQNPCLINELNVLENVLLAPIARNTLTQDDQNKATSLLQAVGLSSVASHVPNTLSGGQQQRVAILRALMQRPTFLLADEPTGNLDAVTAQQILTLLQKYQKEYHMGLIISTHDSKIAQQCDEVLCVKDLKIILSKE